MYTLPNLIEQWLLPSSTTIIISIVVFALILFHFSDGRAFTAEYRPDLETRKGFPLLGNLLEIKQHQDQLLEFWVKALKERKDTSKRLSFTFPGRRIIDCTRPDYIEYIQKTNMDNYVKGPMFQSTMKDVLGEGIFNADGAAWHSQRKATARIFTGNNFRGIISASLEEDLKKLVRVIGHYADRGESFALDKLFFRFTLSSFSHMTFGQRDVGALETGDPVPFAESFDKAQHILDRRFNDPLWKIKEVFGSSGREMRAAIKVLDDFSYSIIDEREKSGLGNITAENKKEKNLDLLSLYMALRDDNGQPMSRKQLRDAVLNLIIAGRDTTAQALSWTFYHLITESDAILDPVRKELSEAGSVDYDTWRKLTQTNALFMEGLRLHPSVPKNGWTALRDDVIPGGPIVKKGDIVFWSDWLMARDESIWGPDAKQYKPSRWVDDAGLLIKESQWKAHMFNGGHRLCLGQDLAKFEAVAVLSALLREFDFEFAPGYLETVPMMSSEKTPKYQPSLTLPMNAPLMVRAARRKQA